MAFDQSTRNRLQKFVNDARNLLSEEFTRQLQATYGLDPKAGSVADVDTLTHLDNRQRQTAHILRDTLAHYLASTHGKGEADRTKQALSRIVREQAFTVLNRLAALRMAEARGFLLESIAKGYNSKGFQLYKQLAGGAQGETGEAYPNYLYSVFDEFSLDLAVLFDRHSAQGRLFPRESALLELLDLINHHEIEPLWAEDETIGWIYQYFNSQEERKKMRAESQAPRNSRELAVRNQFFTPRYVVEFLTDNTLGRIWYEMTLGNTRLVDSCRYLVRRPTEVFLKLGEQAPEEHKEQLKEEGEGAEKESLSQEELLKQTVYILYRAIKDPRCIRMLDPACGSMHFGLYAFDLFEQIYEEAWQLEAELSAEAFVREGDLKPLHQSYDSFEDYKIQIPRLIIEHNIHGVDIDPRAVQIAGLSLWQRAQRAWQQQGIKPQQRPVVRKSNIVCAEPMPGEKALFQEFASSLNPPVLGQLLEAIFDKMELAGEAGTLLKIEEEIQSSIHEARDQWQEQSGTHSVGDMFQTELENISPQKKLSFDLSGVDDESFWDGAEQIILQALSDYADTAESKSDQRRFFAEDAAKGFAFIDLCRKSFDAVLMNPPFGLPVDGLQHWAKKIYPTAYVDIFSSMIVRGQGLLQSGYLGVISSRSFFTAKTLEKWRTEFVIPNLLGVCDLGAPVMDGAVVQSAASVFSREIQSTDFFVIDLKFEKNKETSLIQVVSQHAEVITSKSHIAKYLNHKIVPSLPQALGRSLSNSISLSDDEVTAKQGLKSFDDFRFFRAHWEVKVTDKGLGKVWEPITRGGGNDFFWVDYFSVMNWRNDGAEVGERNRISNGQAAQSRQASRYYRISGCSYTWRASSFRVGIMPRNILIGGKAPAVQSKRIDPYILLALLNSTPYRALVSLRSNANQYETGIVEGLPSIDLDNINQEALKTIAKEVIDARIGLALIDECSPYFSGLFLSNEYEKDKGSYREKFESAISLTESCISRVDEVVARCLELNEIDVAFLKELTELDTQSKLRGDIREFERDLISFSFGVLVGRWVENSKMSIVSGQYMEDCFYEMPDIQPSLSENHKGKGIVPVDGHFVSELSNFWSMKDLSLVENEIGYTLGDYFTNVNGFFRIIYLAIQRVAAKLRYIGRYRRHLGPILYGSIIIGLTRRLCTRASMISLNLKLIYSNKVLTYYLAGPLGTAKKKKNWKN